MSTRPTPAISAPRRRRHISLLPNLRKKLAEQVATQVASSVMYIDQGKVSKSRQRHTLESDDEEEDDDDSDTRLDDSDIGSDGRLKQFFADNPELDSAITNILNGEESALLNTEHGSDEDQYDAVRLMFRAYKRLAELYDINPNMGMRFEPEQDLLIRAVFAGRARNVLSPELFARVRQFLCDEYGLYYFDNYLFICFPRRRGKSLAIAAATAIQLATQIDFKALIVNLGMDLANQNMLHVRRIFNYFVGDPDRIVKCRPGRVGKIPEFHSHWGTCNTLLCIANPDRSPQAPRGLTANGVILDEAQFYNDKTLKTVMPITQVGAVTCFVSSLGSNNNPATEMANRRDERGVLKFRHYSILPGLLEAKVSTDEPGTGVAFNYTPVTRQEQQEWYTIYATTPEMAREFAERDDLERKRRFEVTCLALPAHVTLENFLALSVLMGSDAFKQELANEAIEDMEDGTSRPAFVGAHLDWMGKPENYLDTASLGTPVRICTCLDPAKGTPTADFVIATFAYYPRPGQTSRKLVDCYMVVRMWDFLSPSHPSFNQDTYACNDE